MLGLFTPRCPIGPRERVWVERGAGRLLDLYGQEWLRGTPVLTGEDLRDVLSREPIAAAAIAERMQPQFPFAVSGITWQEEADIAGHHSVEYVPGDSPIGLVPQQPGQSPELRAAHVARCLCEHALTIHTGWNTPEQRPPLAVDLLCVLTGIGLFPANTSMMTRYRQEGVLHWSVQQFQASMPSRMYGYAFALRSWLCEETTAAWSNLMRPDAREPLDAGLKFLRKRRPVVWDDSRDVLRTFRDPPATDEVIRQLRHRDAALQINALDDVAEHGIHSESVCHEIGQLVYASSDEVREESIRTIARLNAESRELGEALTISCDDPVPRIRSLAALALGEIQHPPDDAVETLRKLTGDREPVVSTAAAESLLGFPGEITDDRPRLFRVLRQQLARCNYAGVDRFMQRLERSVADAVGLIDQEFSSAEEAPWRQILLQSLTTAGSQESE